MRYQGAMPVEYREEPCRSALNPVRGMPFAWSLNPYMGCAHRCTFCYVRAFERRADRPWDDRYGRSLRVKTNVAEVLKRELARRSWKRETVAIGAATDPYQPAEARYRLTRACLEVLRDAANPFGILTRGPLVVRDRDVLRDAAARAEVRVWVSCPTLDEDLWRVTEPGTSPPRQRLRAVRMLAEAGVRVSVLMAPLLPGLSDTEAGMTAVVRAARDAGASGVSSGLLHLQPGTREHFLETLAREWPDEAERLRALFAGRGYLPAARQRDVSARLAVIRERTPRRAGLPPIVEPPPDPEPPLLARQLGLAL
jgi:DNA repair photolyase